MEYGKKTDNHGKWETHTVGREIWQETLKKVENEKCTMYDLEYGEKPEKSGKGDKNTAWSGILRETLKMVKNVKFTL